MDATTIAVIALNAITFSLLTVFVVEELSVTFKRLMKRLIVCCSNLLGSGIQPASAFSKNNSYRSRGGSARYPSPTVPLPKHPVSSTSNNEIDHNTTGYERDHTSTQSKSPYEEQERLNIGRNISRGDVELVLVDLDDDDRAKEAERREREEEEDCGLNGGSITNSSSNPSMTSSGKETSRYISNVSNDSAHLCLPAMGDEEKS